MTVKDSKGREWSVKQPYPGDLDSEAPVEVVVSRLLSAVGYHQPPVYYLPAFTLKDDFGRKVEVGGRFRLKDRRAEGSRRRGTGRTTRSSARKEYQGLIVLLMMFNSTDLKNSNNSLYEHRDGDLVEQWYVTRDLGSALGDTNASRRGRTTPSRSRRCRSSSASTTATSNSPTTAGTRTWSAIASRPRKWRGPATCSAG